MPLHDWTRVDAGIFHALRVAWVPEIQKTLNRGLLPEGYYALAEQHAGRAIADVLTLHASPTILDPLTYGPNPRENMPHRSSVINRPIGVDRLGEGRFLAITPGSGHGLRCPVGTRGQTQEPVSMDAWPRAQRQCRSSITHA